MSDPAAPPQAAPTPTPTPPGKLPLSQCKRGLVTLWLGAGGAILGLLFMQTLLGRHASQAETVWGWFLPNIAPTAGLMVGILVADALKKDGPPRFADAFLYKLAFWLSGAHLALLAMVLLAEPFSPLAMTELMKQAGFLLTATQGLVSAALGAFFIKS